MNEELKVIISAEVSKLKQGLNDAKSEIKGFKGQMEKASADVDKNFKSLGNGIATGLKVGATAAVGMGAAMLALVPATQEYRAEQAKLDTTFQSLGSSSEVARATYEDLVSVLGDSGAATECAQQLAHITTNEKDLEKWTTICEGAYASFGDALPVESLAEAANETIKTGKVTGAVADAVNWATASQEEYSNALVGNKDAQDAFNKAMEEGLTVEDALNAALATCNSELEREQVLRTVLTAAHGEAAEMYDKLYGSIKEYNLENDRLTANMGLLGAAIAPIVTAFMRLANEALAVVIPYIQQFAEEYGPKLEECLRNVATSLQEAFTWVQQHSTLLAVIGGVIGAIVIAIGLYNAVAAVKAAMDAAQVVTLAGLAAAYLAQAAAMIVAIAPYVLIVAAIGLVIAAIVLCIKHWDDIKAAVKNAIDGIVGFVKDLVKFVTDDFKQMGENMKQKVEDAKSAVTDKFENIKKNISDKAEAAKSAVSTKFDNIKSTIDSKVEAAKSSVTSKFESIKSNITQKVEAAKSSVQNVFDSMKSKMESTIEGAKSTITSKFDTIKSKITSAINGARDAVQTAVNNIKSIMNFSWSLPKLKLPHISVSGKFSINPPSAPKFSISWYKLGGVFDSPHLFGYGNGMLGGLGEDGAEAVVPLEKNTKWLDVIAEKLNNKQGNSRIILQVDGKTFGEIAIGSINELTRQRGNLPLVMV